MNWDKSVDLLIAGSGGGGMVAALAAIDAGIEPLVVEKQDLVGGSTGMSGGMVWLPNNPLMRADGIPDSHEDGLAYFDDVIGDIGEASSPAPPRDVPHRGQRDDRLPAAQGSSAGPLPRLERLLPEPQGRQRGRPLRRGYPVRLRGARRAGVTRFSRPWPRTNADSWSRPTSCARCSTSTGRRERSPWRCGCSCAPNRPSSGDAT